MEALAIVFGVIVAIVVMVAVAMIVIYNNLVQLRNRVDNAWSQIDVQLQRRLDLIPNLIETVKGYAAHERSAFEDVTRARSAVLASTTPDEQILADNALSGALKNLFAVAEAYPDLKANQNFLQLQNELTNTEDKISYMRQSYNDTVMTYNNSIQTFPGMLLAGLFGFREKAGFSAAVTAPAAPAVAFTPGAPTEPNWSHVPGAGPMHGPDFGEDGRRR